MSCQRAWESHVQTVKVRQISDRKLSKGALCWKMSVFLVWHNLRNWLPTRVNDMAVLVKLAFPFLEAKEFRYENNYNHFTTWLALSRHD